MEFLYFLLIGLAAGWLAGQIMKTSQGGWVFDLALGVIGAILGGWLFSVVGIFPGVGLVGSLITATLGAMILIFLLRVMKKPV